ncbi:MAG: hypothetical protein HN348_34780, partial [Proteobacteria bacterium]|nr:hypothetical protein [Pseudomonadota bacterium]
MSSLQQASACQQSQHQVGDSSAQDSIAQQIDGEISDNSFVCSQVAADVGANEDTTILQNAASSCTSQADFFSPDSELSIQNEEPTALTSMLEEKPVQPSNSRQGERWGSSTAAAATKTGRTYAQRASKLLPGLGRDQLKSMDTAGDIVSAPLSFASHLLGDRQVGSETSHVVGSAVKGGVDTVIGRVPKAGGGPVSGALATADGFVDVDHPAKLATATAAELTPASWVGKAASGGVDAVIAAGTMATDRPSSGYRAAEIVEENAVNGEYSAVSTAATYGCALATGDREVLNAAVDNKAERGERGIWNAMGNNAGDAWADVMLDLPRQDERRRQITWEEAADMGRNDMELAIDCAIGRDGNACSLLGGDMKPEEREPARTSRPTSTPADPTRLTK